MSGQDIPEMAIDVAVSQCHVCLPSGKHSQFAIENGHL
jgi:hypothetical protein